jgi:hypothetical protein
MKAAAHSLDPVKLKRVFGCYLLVTAAFMLKDPFLKLIGMA